MQTPRVPRFNRYILLPIILLIGVSTFVFSLFTSAVQGQTQYNIADINKDGIVDLGDYSLLVANFLKTGPDTQTTPTPTPTQTGGGSEGENAYAMGRWEPNPKFDTCTKEEHDSYYVIGPDGKKYPTWHPPVHTRADGTTCTFGHEHGRDPEGYQYFNEIKEHFAHDADGNGQISASELATAGLPFGYVNEQIALTQSLGFMRHEDHVGHKIEYANGEGDIGQGTDPFDSSLTGGIVVPLKPSTTGRKWDESGIRCYHFHKIHQGVSTPDALTNNLHEAVLHAKCNSTRADFPTSTSILTGMIPFGAPGEYTRFCKEDRFSVVNLGTTDANRNFPGSTGDGMRNIMDRSCVDEYVLLPEGQFSTFPYEIWEGSLRIRTAEGRELASSGGSWEVLDALRYHDPSRPSRIGYSADLCYEVNGNRQTRGGACDAMTNYRQILGITWDDPRSLFRGINRGQYIVPPRIFNQDGPEFWYTDAMGGNASRTPFPGSIKQRIAPVNADTIGKFGSDPRIILRTHDDGGDTVHGPN